MLPYYLGRMERFVKSILELLARLPVGPLVAVVAVAGVYLMSGTPDASARIPHLLGLQVNPAIAKATTAGYFTEVVFRAGGGIAGTVVRQQPETAVVRNKNTTITLEVTRGAAQVRVPDVRRLPVDEARRRIDRGNLKPGTVTYKKDPELESDRVISTVPASGALVDVNTTVHIAAAR